MKKQYADAFWYVANIASTTVLVTVVATMAHHITKRHVLKTDES